MNYTLHFKSTALFGETFFVFEFIHCHADKEEAEEKRKPLELKWIHRLKTMSLQGLIMTLFWKIN